MRFHPLPAAICVTLLLVAGCTSVPAPERPLAARPAPEVASAWTPKGLVHTRTDMVVAANPLAVEAGVAALAAGGSAVDAAIAVQMVLNLVEPQSSGIGGGALLMTYTSQDRAVAMYDGRETAPWAATERLFLDAGDLPLGFFTAVIGGRSVGTPGLLRVLALAHQEHGRLPWAQLFAPAIRLAEQGFPISARLHSAIAAAPRLADDPLTRTYFFDASGAPKAVGTLLRNPELAATLRAIARDGPDAFYTGPIAADIVAKVRGHPRNPGVLDLADLAGYRAVKRTAVCGRYRVRWEICGANLPSSGGAAVLMVLGMLERFDVGTLAPDPADAVHLVSEAYRLAYADRARYMADPDFVCVPLDGLLDPGYLHARADAIDLVRSMGQPRAGMPRGCATPGVAGEAVEHGTTHLSIVDRDGNAVAMTSTIEIAFGSHQMVRGFMLNNELTDFDFVPRDAAGTPVANRVQGGKRPRSSMAPTFVFSGDRTLEAVIGSPGGPQIIAYVVKALLGLIDWKLDVQAAVDLPNFAAQASSVTELEAHTPLAALAPALTMRGHVVRTLDLNSGLHGITRTRVLGVADPGGAGGWWGGADPRREGVAAGH